MNLSISEIAWPKESESEVRECLNEWQVSRIELAPQRSFGNVLLAEEMTVRRQADFWREAGISPSSFQALLFGQDGLFLFDGKEARERMKEVLKAVGRVAGWAGVGPMVFGSPKNRLRGEMSVHEADRIAMEFFREVGDFCHECGSCLVLEANPEAYGADYITRLDQAAELVSRVDSAGFRLHVDAGGLALSGESFEAVVRESAHLIQHVHASQPMLSDFSATHDVHARLASVLHEIHYQGDVAIEMRDPGTPVQDLQRHIEAVRAVYALS